MDAQLQTAMASHQAGDLAAAATGYAAILTADPNNADAWHLAGLLAHQNGSPADAVKHIQTAIRLNSNNAQYFCNLASILNSLDQFEQALTAADQAIALYDSFAAAHVQRGLALGKLDRFRNALDSFNLAMQYDADPIQCLSETANLKHYLGDLSGAIQDIEKSLKIEPENAQAYYHLSRFVSTGDFQFSDRQLNTIKSMLEQKDLNQARRNRLNVALAVHHETKKSYETAFGHYRAAAESIHSYFISKGFKFAEKQRTEIVEDMKAIFTPDLFENFSGAENASDRPIFIVGMPRSGTTLLQQILAKHPSIVAGGELTILRDLICQKFGSTSDVRLRDTFSAINQEWIESTGESYLQHLDMLTAESAKETQTDPHSIKHVIDKLPGNYLYIGFIRLLFPNAAIISCLRDPRDVCLSCYCQSFRSDQLQFKTSKLEYLAVQYRNYANLMDYWQTELPGFIHQFSYEDLLEQPRQQLRKLFGFLNLEWRDECLKFYENGIQVKTASATQVRKPLYKSSREKWRRYESQLGEFNQLIAGEIAAFESSKTRAAELQACSI